MMRANGKRTGYADGGEVDNELPVPLPRERPQRSLKEDAGFYDVPRSGRGPRESFRPASMAAERRATGGALAGAAGSVDPGQFHEAQQDFPMSRNIQDRRQGRGRIGYARGGPVEPREEDTVYGSTAPDWTPEEYQASLRSAEMQGIGYARGGAVGSEADDMRDYDRFVGGRRSAQQQQLAGRRIPYGTPITMEQASRINREAPIPYGTPITMEQAMRINRSASVPRSAESQVLPGNSAGPTEVEGYQAGGAVQEERSPLGQVLDYTRKQFGLDRIGQPRTGYQEGGEVITAADPVSSDPAIAAAAVTPAPVANPEVVETAALNTGITLDPVTGQQPKAGFTRGSDASGDYLATGTVIDPAARYPGSGDEEKEPGGKKPARGRRGGGRRSGRRRRHTGYQNGGETDNDDSLNFAEGGAVEENEDEAERLRVLREEEERARPIPLADETETARPIPLADERRPRPQLAVDETASQPGFGRRFISALAGQAGAQDRPTILDPYAPKPWEKAPERVDEPRTGSGQRFLQALSGQQPAAAADEMPVQEPVRAPAETPQEPLTGKSSLLPLAGGAVRRFGTNVLEGVTGTAGDLWSGAQKGIETGYGAVKRSLADYASRTDQQPRIEGYLNGERGHSPEDMQELFRQAREKNPELSHKGLTESVFNNFLSRKDFDGASRTLQALRQPYDRARAIGQGALANGNTEGAVKAFEHAHDLLPNGTDTSFRANPDGTVTATVKLKDGYSKTYELTQEQFKHYAYGPASGFDHTAENGTDKNLDITTRQRGSQTVPARTPADDEGWGAAGPPPPAHRGGAPIESHWYSGPPAEGRRLPPGVSTLNDENTNYTPKEVEAQVRAGYRSPESAVRYQQILQDRAAGNTQEGAMQRANANADRMARETEQLDRQNKETEMLYGPSEFRRNWNFLANDPTARRPPPDTVVPTPTSAPAQRRPGRQRRADIGGTEDGGLTGDASVGRTTEVPAPVGAPAGSRYFRTPDDRIIPMEDVLRGGVPSTPQSAPSITRDRTAGYANADVGTTAPVRYAAAPSQTMTDAGPETLAAPDIRGAVGASDTGGEARGVLGTPSVSARTPQTLEDWRRVGQEGAQQREQARLFRPETLVQQTQAAQAKDREQRIDAEIDRRLRAGEPVGNDYGRTFLDMRKDLPPRQPATPESRAENERILAERERGGYSPTTTQIAPPGSNVRAPARGDARDLARYRAELTADQHRYDAEMRTYGGGRGAGQGNAAAVRQRAEAAALSSFDKQTQQLMLNIRKKLDLDPRSITPTEQRAWDLFNARAEQQLARSGGAQGGAPQGGQQTQAPGTYAPPPGKQWIHNPGTGEIRLWPP